MKEYRTSLRKRREAARWHGNKYRTDPAYRLARVNYDRVKRGLEPYTHVDQIQPIGSWRKKDRHDQDHQ